MARAAALGRPQAVLRCLAAGFPVDARTPEGITALHEAAVRGDGASAEALLSRGADPTLADPVHRASPAGWAAHAGHEDLAARLADAARRER